MAGDALPLSYIRELLPRNDPEHFVSLHQRPAISQSGKDQLRVERITHQQGEMMNREVLARALSPPAPSPPHGDHRGHGGHRSPGQDCSNRLSDRSAKRCRWTKPPGTSSFPQTWRPQPPPRAPTASSIALGCRFVITTSRTLQGSRGQLTMSLRKQPIGLVVHALNSLPAITPDLCSADDDYRRHSIDELQRVVDTPGPADVSTATIPSCW